MDDRDRNAPRKKPRKPRPEAWPLRRGDLPPERFAAMEPRLAGLEENAFFRVLVMRRHLGRRALGGGGATFGGVSTLVIVVLVLVLVCIALPVLLILYFAQRFTRHRRGPAGLLLQPQQIAIDLIQAGAHPIEFVNGLWGTAVGSRACKQGDSVLAVLAAAPLVLVAVEGFFPSGGVWGMVALPFVFFFMALAAHRRSRPYHALPELARTVGEWRKNLDSRQGAGAVASQTLLITLKVLVYTVVLSCTGAFGFYGLAMALGACAYAMRQIGMDPMGFSGLAVWLAMTAGAGWTIGWAFARHIRASARLHLTRMERDMQVIVNWIASREEAAADPYGR